MSPLVSSSTSLRMDSTYPVAPAGKTRYPPKIQTTITYEHLDREFITASRQDAAVRRSHHARSTSLPKIATGRSIHSAKQLWEDYERIEVRSKVQRENERPPEVSPLRVPKNPHGLCKHAVNSVKPFHILHSQSDYGQAKHQLRQLYAQVAYLSNAVRNCDGSASYRGMCKRQRSSCNNDDNPLRLHWPSSDENIPVPRLLLPVMPGTNTKWYSWKVDTPRGEPSPRGRGSVRGRGRGSDKRYPASAPVSRSGDFLERYSKNTQRVVFSVGDEGGRRSKKKETDTKSRDRHLSVRTIHGTDITESLASSSLSSIVRYDANKLKLKDDEGIAGKAIFLTQLETRKMPRVEEVQTDIESINCHGDQEKKKEEDAKSEADETRASEGDEVIKGKDEEGMPDEIREQSPDDEMDIVARANVAATLPPESPASEETQKATQEDAANSDNSENREQEDKTAEQEVAMATANEMEEPDFDNGRENSSFGNDGKSTSDDENRNLEENGENSANGKHQNYESNQSEDNLESEHVSQAVEITGVSNDETERKQENSREDESQETLINEIQDSDI